MLELKVFVNDRMGMDAKVRLDALGYVWKNGHWEGAYEPKRYLDTVDVLKKSGMLETIPQKVPIIVLYQKDNS